MSLRVHRCTVAHTNPSLNTRSTARDTPDALDRLAIDNDTAMHPKNKKPGDLSMHPGCLGMNVGYTVISEILECRVMGS